MRILCIGPTLAQWSEIKFISKTLEFLGRDYQIDYVDPLENLTEQTTRISFVTEWRDQIQRVLDNYDAFFGFALGGVILQECFDIFDAVSKPLVLYSAPSFIDKNLREKLSEVIDLVNKGFLTEGVSHLNNYIFYPNKPPSQQEKIVNIELASLRLSRGLNFVLQSDCRTIVEKAKLRYINIIGSESQLVTRSNVVCGKEGEVILVPNSGMRMLQDNASYCNVPIKQFLEGYSK